MCIFEMYKIAIEGRNNHYKNYNEWANRYSIITSALFAAYYAIVDKNNILLSLLISFVGLFATLCWYLSMQGYYAWMKSWIKVVHEYENKLNNSNYCCNNCNKNECQCIKKCSGEKAYVYSTYIGDREKKNYVSTQKVTITFISVIAIIWNIVLFCDLKKVLLSENIKFFLCFTDSFKVLFSIFTFLVILVCEILFLTFYKENKLLSNIVEMKEKIDEQ